ncbi:MULTISPECIES: glycoside hydrolase family 3 C-terminal domain-containing protein [Bifidobacterium]|jgi:beta-glucosidase|uniref:Glycosyl hydrolase n=1 Tax=Bifidobacterium tibiigranuli TaxID=2172043 RepID=A0A5N6S910_9BIFI|nr:glycoside hydrolase family 3 C-terminal domain-containing protein [Bifidobacterium tibiigranuli]KAE8129608.1 glycosyl hydrolase [Bifidobacterium tibiigranuli]KAE8129973.1 glycosyl hydrolase [Bifidobacterium tibiigranuli]MCH3975669.1 glycoside hydrolase family 3 C-terminal domain-containing protein [Bifidobacterium tibiigranuli]MCH4190511.1 glycoside hydrolase family 3 C-terminal domain-containing protein [Bifidobacterium tibiigranuli]MCH4202954.1 glycoside hydrolase family 3 C-terminal doma
MNLEELSVEERAALLSGGSEWDSRGNKRAGAPSFVMSDGPHGVRRQLGEGDHLGLGASKPATCFPTAGTVANSWDPDLAEEMGRALGREAHDLDVNVLLGPGMNIKRNPLCGRNFEYYSEDPQVAGRMASGLIKGIQSNGISACPKHFAVNSQELRRQASNSVIDERTMRELYLTAFEIAVREAAPHAIMTSYNQINGVYAHENRHLLQDILRDEWGFDGMVVSDWGGSNSAVAAAKAGGSLEMPSPGYTSVRELIAAVKAGELPESDLNARAAEVAKIAQLTRFEGVGRDDLLRDDIAAAHHDVARTVAENSLVLLKNDAVLPLQSGVRLAVIGDMACTPRFQGSGSSKVNATREENLLDELKACAGVTVAGYRQGYERQGAHNPALVNDAVALAGRVDVDAVIAVVGLDERSESEGLDRATMAMPQAQNELIAALKTAGKPIIAVLVAGSPVELPWLDDGINAVLYVGLSGQAGASAAVRVLTGAVNPSGHLAETWPLRYSDCPSAGWYPETGRDVVYREGPFVGYRYYETAHVPVRFPFGYGLSYSDFTYSGLSFDGRGVDGHSVNERGLDGRGVSFVVTNDSDIPGATVAQLYVAGPAGPEGGVLQPARELKGFRKIRLGAHESKVVHIAFDRYTFRHYDVAAGAWRTQSGRWTLMVGTNVEDLPLTAPFTVTGDDKQTVPTDTVPADHALGHYLTGDVKHVTDTEVAALFEHEVIPSSAPSVFGVNDPISSWKDSKGFAARTIARTLIKREAKIREKTGAPDLNVLFILNMPPRAMSKMTQGMVDSAMVDAVVRIANGHTLRGAGAFIAGFFRNRRANNRLAKELRS